MKITYSQQSRLNTSGAFHLKTQNIFVDMVDMKQSKHYGTTYVHAILLTTLIFNFILAEHKVTIMPYKTQYTFPQKTVFFIDQLCSIFFFFA